MFDFADLNHTELQKIFLSVSLPFFNKKKNWNSTSFAKFLSLPYFFILPMDPLDFRSDTVTKPSLNMRKAMFEAQVGDDVYQDDQTVNHLQTYAAKKFGHSAALFFPTGTQAGLCALLSHCQRGEEYIAGHLAHHYKYEGGGASVLGGIQAQPIEQLENGEMPLEKIRAAIKPADIHFAITRLICLENTFWGRVLSWEYMLAVKTMAKEFHLQFHLDGARIFNAAVEMGCDVKKITELFDSACICLSKGLGAPAGTLLVGSTEFIEKARRWRKICGGGMRQVGILAAAAQVALEDSPKLLLADHQKAKFLAEKLNQKPELKAYACTNMVFFSPPLEKMESLNQALVRKNILARISPFTRLVLHLDIPENAINSVAEVILKET